MSAASDQMAQMAAQLAQLLSGSDRAELAEIVQRWRTTAVTSGQQAAMDKMAEQILALAAAIDHAPAKPTREELELALKMMLRVASGAG
jgi:hypothetical protein